MPAPQPDDAPAQGAPGRRAAPRLPDRLRRRRSRRPGPPSALLVGAFSFDAKSNTAGDVLACNVAEGWLARAGLEYDVAMAGKYGSGVDWETVEPARYSHVVWVAGPVWDGRKQRELRERFAASRLVALDVTLLDELGEWNPYDAVVERDSARVARPDISFLSPDERAPVVGLCLIRRQSLYGERGQHDAVIAACQRLIESRPMAVLEIDTVLKPGKPGRRSAAEVEALLARMDVVVTNRLHGLALSLKHGVPVLALDSVSGGAKVTRQAEAVGWPVVLRPDSLSDEEVARAFESCLGEQARATAEQARRRGMEGAAAVESEFLAALALDAGATGVGAGG